MTRKATLGRWLVAAVAAGALGAGILVAASTHAQSTPASFVQQARAEGMIFGVHPTRVAVMRHCAGGGGRVRGRGDGRSAAGWPRRCPRTGPRRGRGHVG